MDKQELLNIIGEEWKKAKKESGEDYNEVEKEIFKLGCFSMLVAVKEGKIKPEDITV